MIENLSEATDVIWINKPKGAVLKRVKRAIVAGRADASPIPYIAMRACVGDSEPIGYIVSKLHLESPLQMANDLHTVGWSIWLKDDTIIISAHSLPGIEWLVKNISNAWLYTYQPIRDTCLMLRALGIEELIYLTTPYMNHLAWDAEPLLFDDFFIYEVEPQTSSATLLPNGEPLLDLASWLCTWLFACMGGKAQIAGCGGAGLEWSSLTLFDAYLSDLDIDTDDDIMLDMFKDFEQIEKEADKMGEQMGFKLKGDEGGAMFG